MKNNDESIAFLIKNNASVLIILIFAYAVNYFLNLFLAHHLSAESYGDIAVILKLLYFFIPFALLGTDEAGLRFLPEYFRNKEWKKIKGYLQWSHKIILYILILINVINILVFFIILGLEFFNILSWREVHPFFYSIWIIPFFSYVYLQSTYLQVLKKFTLASSIMEIGFPFLLIIILIGFLGFFEKLDVYHVILSMGMACLFLIAIQIVMLVRISPVDLKTYKPQKLKKSWWPASSAMLKGAVLDAGLGAIDIVMLEIFGVDDAQVGEFAAITTITYFLVLFQEAADLIVTPLINVYKNNLHKLQSILNIGNIAKTIPSLIVYLIIIFYGKTLLYFFGEFYVRAYIPLIILATSRLIETLLGFSGLLLFYTKYINHYIKISTIQFVTLIIFYITLIPIYDMFGTVISMFIVNITIKLINNYYVAKDLKLKSYFF